MNCVGKVLEGCFEGGRTAELGRERESRNCAVAATEAMAGSMQSSWTGKDLQCPTHVKQGTRETVFCTLLVTWFWTWAALKSHNLGQGNSLQARQLLGGAEAVSKQQPLLPATGNNKEIVPPYTLKPKQHNIQRGNQYIFINYLSNL